MIQDEIFSKLLFFCTAAIIHLLWCPHEAERNFFPLALCFCEFQPSHHRNDSPSTLFSLLLILHFHWQGPNPDTRLQIWSSESWIEVNNTLSLMIGFLQINAGQYAVSLWCHNSTLWLATLWGWAELGGFPTGYSSTEEWVRHCVYPK